MPHQWRHLVHEQNSGFKCKQHTMIHDPWGPEKYKYTMMKYGAFNSQITTCVMLFGTILLIRDVFTRKTIYTSSLCSMNIFISLTILKQVLHSFNYYVLLPKRLENSWSNNAGSNPSFKYLDPDGIILTFKSVTQLCFKRFTCFHYFRQYIYTYFFNKHKIW